MRISAADRERVRSTIGQRSASSDGFLDYENFAVRKPWGYEYVIYQNQTVAIWVLHIKEGCQTSMHCHPMKQTSLIALGGEVLCSTLNGVERLRPPQGLVLEKGVFHATQTVSRDEAVVMEVETPIDKKDLIRLSDKYGRSGEPYEGPEHHVRLEDLGLDRFHRRSDPPEKEKKLGGCRLAIMKIRDDDEFRRELRDREGSIVVLRGRIVGRRGRSALKDGDAVGLDSYRLLNEHEIHEPIDVLWVDRESD